MFYRILLLLGLFLCHVLAQASEHPELRLLKALQAVQSGQIVQAEQQLRDLLADEPQFRAANLLYADILKSRSQPLYQAGAGLNSSDELNSLISEIQLRWQAHEADVTAGKLPTVLARLDENYAYAFVVDLHRSRLYVFENHSDQPRLVANYFVSMGRAGPNKSKAGDLRTPLGVYFIQSYMPDSELDDKYGIAAYPLNYPNVWDQRLGRTGHGIWLHGTDSGTYNRPPLASEGCVVLPNNDLIQVSQYITLGQTPVIIGNGLEWMESYQWIQYRASINSVFEQWLADWRSLDTEKYLQHYSHTFTDGKKNFAQFSVHKRNVAQGKTFVDVTAKFVSLLLHPNEDMMVVTFLQDYNSNNFASQTWKRQYWQKEQDGQWRIIHEAEVAPQLVPTRLAKSSSVEVQQAN